METGALVALGAALRAACTVPSGDIGQQEAAMGEQPLAKANPAPLGTTEASLGPPVPSEDKQLREHRSHYP